MESDRMRLMAEEQVKIASEKLQHPELFPEITWTDNNSSLAPLGIYIPDKDLLPRGYLKLLPSDFIVEEQTKDGYQTTIGSAQIESPASEGQTVYATLIKCGLS